MTEQPKPYTLIKLYRDTAGIIDGEIVGKYETKDEARAVGDELARRLATTHAWYLLNLWMKGPTEEGIADLALLLAQWRIGPAARELHLRLRGSTSTELDGGRIVYSERDGVIQ